MAFTNVNNEVEEIVNMREIEEWEEVQVIWKEWLRMGRIGAHKLPQAFQRPVMTHLERKFLGGEDHLCPYRILVEGHLLTNLHIARQEKKCL